MQTKIKRNCHSSVPLGKKSQSLILRVGCYSVKVGTKYSEKQAMTFTTLMETCCVRNIAYLQRKVSEVDNTIYGKWL